MTRIIKKFRLIVFSLILITIWRKSESILQRPIDPDWNTKGLEQIRSKENFYDVIISGTSMSITNINAEELYLNYGIASSTIGEPEQIAFLSYYSIKQALEYQKPKVILLDIEAFLYSYDRQVELLMRDENYSGHYTIDNFTNFAIKHEAVKQLKQLKSDTDYWNYFSPMYYNHSNWENISNNNFKSNQSEDIILGSKTLFGNYENVYDYKYIKMSDNTNDKTDMTEINLEYLYKIKDLCKEKDVDLILLRSCGNSRWSWGEYNAIQEIAETMEIEYLDMALYEQKIGFDWKVDSYDGRHHNAIGAKKWTDFIGTYLKQKYDFDDRRIDTNYHIFQKEKDRYENILSALENRISLLKAINLNQYLDTLLNMEKEGNSIFIVINKEATEYLKEENISCLKAIGIDIDLPKLEKQSFCGVLDDGKVIVVGNNRKQVFSGYLTDGTKFSISNEDIEEAVNSSILINGNEYLQDNLGINIVVYNKKCNQILSSVFFSTNDMENPTTARKNITGITELEKDINCWIAN